MVKISYLWAPKSEHFLNFCLKGERVVSGAVVVDNFSICVHEELSKVPWYFAGFFLLCIVQRTIHSQELVDRVGISAVDVDLWKHREFHAVCRLCPFLDLGFWSWLLASELVAREGKDLETLVTELLMELNHFFVVLGGEASLCGHVHNHDAWLACNYRRERINHLTVDVLGPIRPKWLVLGFYHVFAVLEDCFL